MEQDRKEAISGRLHDVRQLTERFISGMRDEQWAMQVFSSEGGDWTAADVLRHVADSESGLLGTMQRIRAGGEGVPANFDLARWNASRVAKTRNKTPQQLLEQMDVNRKALLAFLEEITAEDLDKKGRHASLRIMSIEEILHQIADHEETHIQEIQAAIGAG